MPFTVTPTAIPEVLVLEPKVFGDARGFFYESFNARDFAEATGLQVDFVQDNHSKSARGVLRGLHYQIAHAQGKLVRVVQGEVFDVAVDLRRSSPTFGQWGVEQVEVFDDGALIVQQRKVLINVGAGQMHLAFTRDDLPFTGQYLQQRGLAAAVGPTHGDAHRTCKMHIQTGRRQPR